MAIKYYHTFQTEGETDSGYMVDGLEAICECGEKVFTPGIHEGSEKRCAVLLREKCSNGKFFYKLKPPYYPE